MIDAFFITGTDTDVGKTVASRAILQVLAKHEFKTTGYKPIAAGCDLTPEGWRNSDAIYLQKEATVDMPYEQVNPYALEFPASPHISAHNAGINIDFQVLSNTLATHKSESDVVLIEGAGGWRVPVSDKDSLSTWVSQEALPVILVVGIKLGCLNHAVLTAEIIKSDGLNLVGWIANRVNPGIEQYSEIIEFLEKRLDAPKLGEIPYIPAKKHNELGKYIDLEKFLNL